MPNDGPTHQQNDKQDAWVSGDAATWSATYASKRTDSEEVADLRADLSELTTQLQRVAAEYANYRKQAASEAAKFAHAAKESVNTALIPVLDCIEQLPSDRKNSAAFDTFAAQFKQILTDL